MIYSKPYSIYLRGTIESGGGWRAYSETKNADSETKSADSETEKRGFGNWDSETTARGFGN